MTSATERTLARLRTDERFTLVQKVEYYQQRAGQAFGVRRDLWGLIDILAVGPGIVLGVQSTTIAGWYEHLRKIREHDNIRALLASPIAFELWAWEKKGARWQVKTRRFELATTEHIGVDHESTTDVT